VRFGADGPKCRCHGPFVRFLLLLASVIKWLSPNPVDQWRIKMPTPSPQEARNVGPLETQTIVRPSFTVSVSLVMMSLMLAGTIYVFVTYLH